VPDRHAHRRADAGRRDRDAGRALVADQAAG
jgi:hypothetical protein